MSLESSTTCYEAIAEVDEAIRSVTGGRYYVLGGIVSSALRHVGTEFSHATQTVLAPDEASEGVIRDNGTVRDIDILLDEVVDSEVATSVTAAVEKAVSGALVVSVFGFDAHKKVGGLDAAKACATEWISRRTMDENGVRRYELFPISQVVSDKSFEPWNLQVESGGKVSMLHPAGHTLAYAMRSISGVRYKDAKKIDELITNVFSDPECLAAVEEGEFGAWLDFAIKVWDMRDGKLAVDVVPRSVATAFMCKGKFLRWLESKERVIEIAQGGGAVQDLLKPFVHAK